MHTPSPDSATPTTDRVGRGRCSRLPPKLQEDAAKRVARLSLIAAAVLKDPASYIPPRKYPVIHHAALESCDARDGLKDGLLDNPTKCAFDQRAHPTAQSSCGPQSPAKDRSVDGGNGKAITSDGDVLTARRL
jgi:tannase/feruloyl esterase